MNPSQSGSQGLSRPHIFVWEQNNQLHRHLRNEKANYNLTVSSNLPQAIDSGVFHNGSRPNLVIIDVSNMRALDGLQIAKELRQYEQTIPILLITQESSEDFARTALRTGISDYVKEPFDLDELSTRIAECISKASSKIKEKYQQPSNLTRSLPDTLIGISSSIKDVRDSIANVASTDSNVLITGETGTGKELVAQAIHRYGRRHQQAFVCVNCAAIPATLLESELFGYERGAFTGAIGVKRGKLELAQGGTILFDEIGDMELSAQAKVLRAIEERQVHRLGGNQKHHLDIRIIAATNQNLEEAMSQNQFRSDLYYRLNVARIELPPLRERKEDISILTKHFIREFNPKFNRNVEDISEEAMGYLLDYSWPGNVRELRNLIEASFIHLRNPNMRQMDLPPQFRAKAKECESLPQNERDRILAALLSTNWCRTKAADKLQWSRMTLYRKMLKHNVVYGNGKTTHEKAKQILPSHSSCNIL